MPPEIALQQLGLWVTLSSRSQRSLQPAEAPGHYGPDLLRDPGREQGRGCSPDKKPRAHSLAETPCLLASSPFWASVSSYGRWGRSQGVPVTVLVRE